MLNIDKGDLGLIRDLLGAKGSAESDFRARALLLFNDAEALNSHLSSWGCYSVPIAIRANIIMAKTANILPNKSDYYTWLNLLSKIFDSPIRQNSANPEMISGLIVGIFQSLKAGRRFFQGEHEDEFRRFGFSIVAKMVLGEYGKSSSWSRFDKLEEVENAAKEWVRQTDYLYNVSALKRFSPLFEEIYRKLPGTYSEITKRILNGLVYGLFGALGTVYMIKLLSFIPLLENRTLSVSRICGMLDALSDQDKA
ncbi:MAG: hypothetical protein WC610_00405 [Patescibacteria group bacterium]